MREKRFKSPRDIWYANLKTFLDLEMDPDMQWIKKVHERAFPDDAMMFIHHISPSSWHSASLHRRKTSSY